MADNSSSYAQVIKQAPIRIGRKGHKHIDVAVSVLENRSRRIRPEQGKLRDLPPLAELSNLGLDIQANTSAHVMSFLQRANSQCVSILFRFKATASG